jgi:hypothetical protein
MSLRNIAGAGGQTTLLAAENEADVPKSAAGDFCQ